MLGELSEFGIASVIDVRLRAMCRGCGLFLVRPTVFFRGLCAPTLLVISARIKHLSAHVAQR